MHVFALAQMHSGANSFAACCVPTHDFRGGLYSHAWSFAAPYIVNHVPTRSLVLKSAFFGGVSYSHPCSFAVRRVLIRALSGAKYSHKCAFAARRILLTRVFWRRVVFSQMCFRGTSCSHAFFWGAPYSHPCSLGDM
jgi:hypothetical protein